MKREPGQRKVRGDAILRNLPQERQDLIAEHGNTHKLRETLQWLADDGINVSKDTLSQFLSAYVMRAAAREDEATVETIKEELRREVEGISDEELDAFGQKTFSLLAIRRKDLPGFVSIRSAKLNAELEKAKLALKEKAEARHQELLKLEQSKYRDMVAEKMLDQALRDQAERIANSNLSNADKIAAMRQAAFADVDALEASGKVVLPQP